MGQTYVEKRIKAESYGYSKHVKAKDDSLGQLKRLEFSVIQN